MSGLLPFVLAQQQPESGGAASSIVLLVFYLAIIVVSIIGLWKVFEKAGQPGWAAIIPIYNVYVMLQIAGRPVWWLIFIIIPCLNLILLVLPFDIATKFGKGIGFGLGLLFLPFIFYPILGFGDARYQGSVGQS
jgi:hypothetical protein